MLALPTSSSIGIPRSTDTRSALFLFAQVREKLAHELLAVAGQAVTELTPLSAEKGAF
jgi:hypothetical protein